MQSIAMFLLVCLGVYFFMKRRHVPQTALMPESLYKVHLCETLLGCVAPSGSTQSIPWSDIFRVEIRTTDEGPFNPDVFWEIFGEKGKPTVVVVGGATGEQEMIEAFQKRLPGFRNDQLIKAMGSADNARFVCWVKEI